jgi:hypothetical protein
MSHLSPERLAELGDERPTPTELAHLSSCAACAAERAAFESLDTLSRAEPVIGVPLTRWETLAPALRAEGLMVEAAASRGRGHRMHRGWLQAAAAVLLVTGGMIAGRMTAGDNVLADPQQQTTQAAAAQADSVPQFSSVEEALAARARYEQFYQAATAFVAQYDTTSASAESPRTYATRLATVGAVRDMVGAALQESPYDPVLNGYYLDASSQYEATVRRWNTAMPGGLRLQTY